MVEILKVTIGGHGAVFKRPHINSVNLTYSHIHKIALLGILGCLIKLPGINQQQRNEEYPGYYKELNGLRVSIVPRSVRFPIYIDTITETTGFCNKNSTYIANYQTLINPKWDIYIIKGVVSNEIYDKLKDFLINHKAYLIPYLGKNQYQADISAKVLKGTIAYNVNSIDSLFMSKDIETIETDDTDNEDYYFSEYMPVKLTPFFNYYKEEEFKLTNDCVVNILAPDKVISCDNKTLYFF